MSERMIDATGIDEMIEEMIDGPTLDDDELASLDLLKGSTDAEVAMILSSVGEKEKIPSHL